MQVLCGVTKVWYVFGPSRFGHPRADTGSAQPLTARIRIRRNQDPVFRSSSSTSSRMPRSVRARAWPSRASAPVACVNSSARLGRQHGHAQRVDGAPLRGHGAHLGVDEFCQLVNVHRVLPGQVIGLIVDRNRCVTRGAVSSFFAIRSTSQFERIELGEQPLDALAHHDRARRAGSELPVSAGRPQAPAL